jgi:deazaflavin-dependent oxidoreductase (nitroreductase family)
MHSMAGERNWNAEVIAAFRANGGEVPAPYEDPPPMLLLHTIGAKSGKEHIVPMRAMPDGDSLYVFATAHGSDRDPDWFHNIVANPAFTIERGVDTIPVQATALSGAERSSILERWRIRVPLINDVLQKTSREIPVVRLDPGHDR